MTPTFHTIKSLTFEGDGSTYTVTIVREIPDMDYNVEISEDSVKTYVYRGANSKKNALIKLAELANIA